MVKLSDGKAHFYAAHAETVLSLIKLMEMNVSETPISAGVIIDYEPNSDNLIMRLAHKSDPLFCEHQIAVHRIDSYMESKQQSLGIGMNFTSYQNIPFNQ